MIIVVYFRSQEFKLYIYILLYIHLLLFLFLKKYVYFLVILCYLNLR